MKEKRERKKEGRKGEKEKVGRKKNKKGSFKKKKKRKKRKKEKKREKENKVLIGFKSSWGLVEKAGLHVISQQGQKQASPLCVYLFYDTHWCPGIPTHKLYK